MLIFDKKQDLITHLKSISISKTTIGFVPTMGALHKGHLMLMEQSMKNNTITVMSIFVNPTQFNNPEDLAKYPRTLESDIEKIKIISDTIIVFAPSVLNMYEGETVSKSFDFDGLENLMEGKFRPGHFNGVGTIVKLLFEIVEPTNAYFGEKDFQQLLIVRKMVEKSSLKVNVVCCPIFREPNGLAMSSRNNRLSADERVNAAIIYKTILEAKRIFASRSASEVTDFVEKVFKNNSQFKLEYFEIADEKTLLTCVNKTKNHNYRAFIAVFVNSIRLIDTISL